MATLAHIAIIQTMFTGCPAYALTLEDRVSVLEKATFTKEDAAAMRIEQKADAAAMRAEQKADMAAMRELQVADATAMRAEQKADAAAMRADMAAMNLENRLFSFANLGLSLVIPAMTYSRLKEMDAKEEAREKQQAREKVETFEREKELKNRSLKKDLKYFANYFNFSDQ